MEQFAPPSVPIPDGQPDRPAASGSSEFAQRFRFVSGESSVRETRAVEVAKALRHTAGIPGRLHSPLFSINERPSRVTPREVSRRSLSSPREAICATNTFEGPVPLIAATGATPHLR